jgi:DNA uptake protein ComE-like DNA-binding protein
MRTILRLLACTVTTLCVCSVVSTHAQDHFELPKSTQPDIPVDQRVDINHASIEDLLKLPGMTPGWAARVVRFRPYRTKQDLLDKGIVNSQVYDRVRQSIIAHRDRH